MSDNVLAAIAGAMTAGCSKWNQGKGAVIQTIIIGFASSYFLAQNLVLVVEKYLGVTLLYGAAYFLCALYGPAIFKRATQKISKW